MEATTQYTDAFGTAAADLNGRGFSDLQKHFNLDEKTHKIVGISLGGVNNKSLRLLCEKTDIEPKKYISIHIDTHENEDLFKLIFERFNVVLFGKFDKESPKKSFEEGYYLSDIIDGYND